MRIIFDRENQPKSQADPYIFAWGGKYYIYATGGEGVHCYVSDKLESGWEYLGIVFSREGKQGFWAPCVYEEGGKIYMYASYMPVGTDDTHEERIFVAVSDTPDGQFTFVKELLEPFSIDPHVVKSGDGLYMFYSVNDYEAERAGTYIVVRKMASPTEMEGEEIPVVRPTLDEEIFQRDRFRVGQHWHTLEGAFYFREGDYHYLIYSGNCYMNEFYYLGYAVAYGAEDDLTKLTFRKYPAEDVYAPLIAKNEVESGTGHNSVIKVDGTYYCVYHGRDLGDVQEYDNRSARICPLSVEDGVLKAIR